MAQYRQCDKCGANLDPCEKCDCATPTPPQYDTIAVDFDGTLCEYRFPDIGEPKPLVIAFIKQHAARGTKIILHTCREDGTRRALLSEAVAWCAAHKIPLYAVNENPENTYPEQYGVNTAGRKVYADLYIDDKAINTADIERVKREWQPIHASNADIVSRYCKAQSNLKAYP